MTDEVKYGLDLFIEDPRREDGTGYCCCRKPAIMAVQFYTHNMDKDNNRIGSSVPLCEICADKWIGSIAKRLDAFTGNAVDLPDKRGDKDNPCPYYSRERTFTTFRSCNACVGDGHPMCDECGNFMPDEDEHIGRELEVVFPSFIDKLRMLLKSTNEGKNLIQIDLKAAFRDFYGNAILWNCPVSVTKYSIRKENDTYILDLKIPIQDPENLELCYRVDVVSDILYWVDVEYEEKYMAHNTFSENDNTFAMSLLTNDDDMSELTELVIPIEFKEVVT